MTITFYSQEELDAALAKQRLQIRAELLQLSDVADLRSVADRIGQGDYARTLAVAPMPPLPPEARDGMPIGYFIADPLDPKLHHPCSPKGWWYVDSFLKTDQECIDDAREHAAMVYAGQTDVAQQELDAALTNERLQICAWLKDPRPDGGPAFLNEAALDYAVDRISKGLYPKSLVEAEASKVTA